MIDDYPLIEASFLKQYGIRIRTTDMTSGEFYNLLSGLMEDTPLGHIVEIRSEEDSEKLKKFTPEMKKIRNEWRTKIMEENHKKAQQISADERKKNNDMIREMFERAFRKK